MEGVGEEWKGWRSGRGEGGVEGLREEDGVKGNL